MWERDELKEVGKETHYAMIHCKPIVGKFSLKGEKKITKVFQSGINMVSFKFLIFYPGIHIQNSWEIGKKTHGDQLGSYLDKNRRRL